MSVSLVSFVFRYGLVVKFEVFNLFVMRIFLKLGSGLIIGKNFGVNGLNLIFVLSIVVFFKLGVIVNVLWNILCKLFVVIWWLKLVLFLCVVLIMIWLLLNVKIYWLFGGIIIGIFFVVVFLICRWIICFFWNVIKKLIFNGFKILFVYVFIVIIIFFVKIVLLFIVIFVIWFFLWINIVLFFMKVVLCFFVVFINVLCNNFLFICVVLLIWIELYLFDNVGNNFFVFLVDKWVILLIFGVFLCRL